jgi:long-chain acyl-CoA synthetase
MLHQPVLDQPDVTFPDALRHNARFYAERRAVVFEGRSLTWAEFDRKTNQVANALLAGGLQRGDRVVQLASNGIEAFELLWGTVKAGGVTVPLNTMMAPEAIPAMVNNADPKFIFVDDASIDLLNANRTVLAGRADSFHTLQGTVDGLADGRAMIDSSPEDDPGVQVDITDTMSIIYSSGTTGTPKGIEHTHRARMVYPLGFGPALKIDRYTVALCSTPLYTNGTWITMLPALFSGGTVILGGKFGGEAFLDSVEREQVTHAFVVPTQLIGILAAPNIDSADTSSLEMVLSGRAPLTTQTFTDVVARFGEHVLYEVVGWSAALMKGYYQEPERTAEMLWAGPMGRTDLRSGDVGRIDEDGFVHISAG